MKYRAKYTHIVEIDTEILRLKQALGLNGASEGMSQPLVGVSNRGF